MPDLQGTSKPAFLQRHLGLSLPEFLALSPSGRAAAAEPAAPDLHFFLDEGVAFEDRVEPSRTRALAGGLFAALREQPTARAEQLATLEQRIVTDGLLRQECDRDQNVYLSKLFTRRLTHAVPDLLFLPESAAEISAALTWARGRGVPVTLRGAATTAMGGAIPSDAGLVLDLSRLDAIEIDASERRVWIGAGTRMRPLHRVLREAGLALPVYPSNLGGTFAGWLATGGIGMNAYGRGRALDAVHAAELVLPTGETVRLGTGGGLAVVGGGSTTILSAEDRERWFRERGYDGLELSDLAGTEGQLGVVTRLCLRVEPLPELAALLLAFEREADALAAVDWIGALVRDGRLDAAGRPADVKLLSGSHLHHVEAVWREEDAKAWRRRPGALSSDAELPWSRVLGPAELGVAPDEGTGEGGGRTGAYLFVDFLGAEPGRAFAALLGECPGAPRVLAAESVRFARDRFRPQQVKRLGPGLLAAEILLPARHVRAFLPAAERLARHAGLELDAEVYFLADGTALAIAGYLCDHRRGSFRVDLLLAPSLLDLAMARFEGEPYVLGRWQANLFARKFGATEARRLREAKRRLDPDRIVNRGAFFDMGLRGPLGLGLKLVMGPVIRGLRLVNGTGSWLSAFLRAASNLVPGPAAGRGLSAPEAAAEAGAAPAEAAATGRALTCVNCGECNSVCPIFRESRIRLPQMLTHVGESLHGGEPLLPTGTTLLDLCMRCGNCEEVCQAGIPHLSLYDAMQAASDAARPRDRERHVLLLERLRGSRRYLFEFLGARDGGYLKRAQAALPGTARYLLLRAEGEDGPAATCIHCAACVDVCPTAANEEFQGEDPRWITTVQSKCIGCGTCVEVCPANRENGGQTLRVMEAPTLAWFGALEEFAMQEEG